jgi:hypothetical protein
MSDLCLICRRSLSEHDMGLGLPTCRGMAVPTYRPTPDLSARIIARADQVLAWYPEGDGDYSDGFREAWREARLMARGE